MLNAYYGDAVTCAGLTRQERPHYWFRLGNGRVALAVYDTSAGWYPLVVDSAALAGSDGPPIKMPRWAER